MDDGALGEILLVPSGSQKLSSESSWCRQSSNSSRCASLEGVVEGVMW